MNESSEANERSMVDACLIRIQQSLIVKGYGYFHGDLETWPRCSVWMEHKESALWICPIAGLSSDQLDELMECARQDNRSEVGLLLVGDQAIDDPVIDGLFRKASKTMAYIDAERGEYRRYWKYLRLTGSPPSALKRRHLKTFLKPAEPGIDEIDCRAILQRGLIEHNTSRDFQVNVGKVGRIGHPYVTFATIGLCVAIYLVVLLTGAMGISSDELVAWGALFGPLVREGESWRILSTSLLHASFLHLFMNCAALNVFGTELEFMQGRWRLLSGYVFSIITASLASLWWSPTVVSVGASGGIFGLIGFQTSVLIRFRKDFPESLWRRVGKGLLIIFALNGILLFVPFIDGAAHAGGFIGGLVMGSLVSRSPVRLRQLAVWEIVSVGLLICLTAAFGVYVISRIP